MRLRDNGAFWSVNLSADETYDWANRSVASWPCSRLAGKPIWAQFDKRTGDLVDLTIRNRRTDIDSHEFNAIMADLVNPKAIARGWGAH